MIGVVANIGATSVQEQAQLVAERVGGRFITTVNPFDQFRVLVFLGAPNLAWEMVRAIRTKYRVCYWIAEGILTAVGRKRARLMQCDLNIAPSKAVKLWMEEGDVSIDYVIPHEIVPPYVYSKGEKEAVYVAGNYPRKWTHLALATLKAAQAIAPVEAYYKVETPEQFAKGLHDLVEQFGVRRLEKMDKQRHYEFLSQYGVFANLSAGEGFGLYIREALAMGMNVVSVEHDAFWDVMDHPCFYKVPHRDVFYFKGGREEMLEEYRTWEPERWVEALGKALQSRCTSPLPPVPHYNMLKMLIYQYVK